MFCNICSKYVYFLVVADCGILTNIGPLMVTFNSTLVNSTVIYSCQEGYDLMGNSTRFCGPAGSWIGDVPTCQSESFHNTGMY